MDSCRHAAFIIFSPFYDGHCQSALVDSLERYAGMKGGEQVLFVVYALIATTEER